jgi:WD40 repeat protein
LLFFKLFLPELPIKNSQRSSTIITNPIIFSIMKTFSRVIVISFSLFTMINCQVNAQLMKTYASKQDEITAISATPDGKLIALGKKSSIEIQNTETDAVIYNLPTSSEVNAICLSQDGNLMVVSFNNSDKSRNLLFWDFRNNIRSQIMHTHTNRILCIAISPDGNLLATGSKDHTIKLFETKYFKELRTLPVSHTNEVTSLKFSPDNKLLVSGSKDKTVIVWDLDTNNDLKTYIGHKKKVNSVAFSPDSKLIASGSDDRTIMIWDVYNSSKPLFVLLGHKNTVTAVEFTPDGRFLGSGSTDKTIQIWDYKNRVILDLKNTIGRNQGEDVNFISFYSEGKLLTCSGNSYLKYWNWGFPILSINRLKIEDKNHNNKIEGNEEVKLTFNIHNSGDGNASNLKFNVSEIQRVHGLTYLPTFYIETIPARTDYKVEIMVSASSKLINAGAKFCFRDFMMVSNTPFPLKDTCMSIETVAAPFLQIDTIQFIYPDTSTALSGSKTGTFNIHLKNSGVGVANNVQIKVSCDKPTSMLDYSEVINFGNIGNSTAQILKIPVKATTKAQDGKATFGFEISETSGLSNLSANCAIFVKKYQPTLTEEIRAIVENKIIGWQNKSKWETTSEYKDRVTESSRDNQISLFTQGTLDSLVKENLNWSKAVTDYDADNQIFKIILTGFDPIFLKVPRNEARIFEANFKQYKLENMSYTVNKNNYAFLHLELVDSISLNKNYFYNSNDLIAFSPTQLNLSFDPVNISLANSGENIYIAGQARSINIGKPDVDLNIPEVIISNPNIYAVVIGNEDYKSNQLSLKSESNVDFAEKDAEVFANYLMLTYGVPAENIRLHKNATYAIMNQDIAWLSNIAANNKGDAELIFYYSGHGLPNENTGEGYLIPVDVNGNNLALAIKLGNLYSELSKWPTKKVTVFLDACFSGGGRNESLLALKKVKIKPKEESVSGNMVVFTSSSGEESSGFYKEKQHGLFTYYLLKKIQETKGSADYQSLFYYLKQEVSLKSLVVNSKEQNPQMIVSPQFPVELSKVRIGTNLLPGE